MHLSATFMKSRPTWFAPCCENKVAQLVAVNNANGTVYVGKGACVRLPSSAVVGGPKRCLHADTGACADQHHPNEENSYIECIQSRSRPKGEHHASIATPHLFGPHLSDVLNLQSRLRG